MNVEEGKDDGQNELDTLVENMTRLLEQGDRELYSPEVIAEFKNPTHAGRMSDADGSGIADGLCQDTMEIYIKVSGDEIERCMFYTDGCGASIACGNRLARFVEGMSMEDARRIRASDVVSLLNGLPADHEHCAALTVIALNNALRDFEAKRPREERA